MRVKKRSKIIPRKTIIFRADADVQVLIQNAYLSESNVDNHSAAIRFLIREGAKALGIDKGKL